MVIQNTRQVRMQKTAMSFTRRSAVRSCTSSALQPDFRILWKVSIFPAHGVPVELRDGVVMGMHGQIGDQLPVDPWPMLWFLTLLGVQHHEVERSGLPLASRTSTSCSPLISSSFISGDRVLAITRQAIASPHQKMGA